MAIEKFVIEDKEIAGFGLAGYVQADLTIKLFGSNRFIEEWPEEIYFMGNTYELESITDGDYDPINKTTWQNAEYA